MSAEDKRALGFENKDNGEFFMLWRDFIKHYDMIDICKIDESYSYNFLNFQNHRDRPMYFTISTKRSGKAFVGLHQPDNRAQPDYIKSLGYARSTIVLAKASAAGYRFVKATMELSFCDTYLEADLEPGTYVAFTMLEWPGKEGGEGAISLYFENNAVLQQAEEEAHPAMLEKAYLDYALRSPGKQVVGSEEDWLFIKLMFAAGGFGVIAAKARTMGIKVSGTQQDFLEHGFELRAPFRGQFEMVVGAGESRVLLARVARDFKAEKIRFPPETIKVQRVQN